MKRLVLCTLLLVTASACKKDKGPEAPGNSGGGGDTPSTDPYACAADDDCVAVELACCDACNGGEQVGVNKAHVDEVKAAAFEKSGDCLDVACTEMACPPPVPACEAGTCVLRPGTFE